MKHGVLMAGVLLAGSAVTAVRADDVVDAALLKSVRDSADEMVLFWQVGELTITQRYCNFDYKADRLETFASQRALDMAKAFEEKNSGSWDSIETRRRMRTAYVTYVTGIQQGAASSMKDFLSQMDLVKGISKPAVCTDSNGQYQSFVAKYSVPN